MSVQWRTEETADGLDHIGVFEDKDGLERNMVVSPSLIDDQVWYGLEQSDTDVLDVGDEQVFFSNSGAARDYCNKLVNVFLGHLPPEAGGINFSASGEQEWSPLVQA